MPGPIIALCNLKGGVGKTSTTHHLAGTLARSGRRVLLVDNDPQSSLTQGFFGPSAARAFDPSATVAALYRGDRPFPAQVIRPTGLDGIDLVAGSRAAASYNVPDPHAADAGAQACLREFLAEVRDDYDVTLIDCPPNLHLCSWAALVASDFLIVPLQPEDYGAQGIADVRESVALVTAGPNPSLVLLGYLLTMVAPRRTLHQVYEESLRAEYGGLVFRSRVPEAVDYPEAIMRRLPVALYRPRGAAARAIAALADEVLGRIEAASGVGDPATTTEAA